MKINRENLAEQAKKVVAVTAAIAAGVGVTACERSTTSNSDSARNIVPAAVVNLAKDIEKLPVTLHYFGPTDGLYVEILPNHEVVETTLTSSTAEHGKPNPNTLNSMAIDMYPTQGTGENLAIWGGIYLGIDFYEQPNGKWLARKVIDPHPNSLTPSPTPIETVLGNRVRTFVEVSDGNAANGYGHEADVKTVYSSTLAHKDLASIESQASDLIHQAILGKPDIQHATT